MEFVVELLKLSASLIAQPPLELRMCFRVSAVNDGRIGFGRAHRDIVTFFDKHRFNLVTRKLSCDTRSGDAASDNYYIVHNSPLGLCR